MTEIEDEKAQRDLGVTMYRIYAGARSEGAGRMDAYLILMAWCRAMFSASQESENQSEGDDE